jgi:hypothetical protein
MTTPDERAPRKPDKRRIVAALKHQRTDRVPNIEVLVDNPSFDCGEFIR